MRGRQSANPLNKLGFALARENYKKIKITDLGNKLLAGDYDIGSVFFKSMLKLQFPNPWSTDFSEKEGFNLMPFIATMRLIDLLNRKSGEKGISKNEFCVFIPTLTSYGQINKYVDIIVERRKSKNKDKIINKFVETFYGIKPVPEKKFNNLFDYGDNILRYFRLTRYFKISVDNIGSILKVDLEPSRSEEIKQLISKYTGEAIKFKSLEDYLSYLADITQPKLPWEEIENLRKIAVTLKENVLLLIEREKIELSQDNKSMIAQSIETIPKSDLEKVINNFRKLRLSLITAISNKNIKNNVERLREIIQSLKDKKEIKKYSPEQFEKVITEALKILNDEILITPNYPVDDNGEPINHATGNKPDIECYYKSFKAICEVTLNVSKLQWVFEGQPIMRHLRDFELQNKDSENLCVFIAPKINNDTYSQFWISVKHEYDGVPQKIIPLTTEQYVILLETLLEMKIKGKELSHKNILDLYNKIITHTKSINGYSEWLNSIPGILNEWQSKMVSA